MNIRQIKETCIYSKNLEAARAFYHEKLGLEVISYVKEKHIFFRAGSSVLLCFNPDDSRLKASPPPHYSTGRYHFAFEVSPGEYEQHKAEIISKGIPIVDTVVWSSGQESFYFEDGLGNIVEIVPVGIW
ncbi:MAG TPA: VOC family protein [Cyclobacteriaceae bacterium]|nr:VOC family protein [Cyclobacteriaceae bacterium]